MLADIAKVQAIKENLQLEIQYLEGYQNNAPATLKVELTAMVDVRRVLLDRVDAAIAALTVAVPDEAQVYIPAELKAPMRVLSL